MINSNDPLVQLKITSATCSFFALSSTIYRIYTRRGRLWADDFYALFAFASLIIQVVAVFLHLPLPNNLSPTARVAVYYLMATTFYAVIWASRLSILFSIVRVDPSVEGRRRLFWVALAFVAAFCFLIAQLLWVCEPEPSWKEAPNPQCQLPLQVAICQLVTDIIADSILLLAPVPLFRHLADRPLRRKLTLIFSTCVITTIVSLVHAVYILKDGGIKVVISALVEDCLSLIVANIPVVVTSVVDISDSTQASSSRRTTSMHFSTMPWFSAFTRSITTGLTSTAESDDDDDEAIRTVNLRTLNGREHKRPSDHVSKHDKRVSAISWAARERPSDAEVGADEVAKLHPARTLNSANPGLSDVGH